MPPEYDNLIAKLHRPRPRPRRGDRPPAARPRRDRDRRRPDDAAVPPVRRAQRGVPVRRRCRRAGSTSTGTARPRAHGGREGAARRRARRLGGYAAGAVAIGDAAPVDARDASDDAPAATPIAGRRLAPRRTSPDGRPMARLTRGPSSRRRPTAPVATRAPSRPEHSPPAAAAHASTAPSVPAGPASAFGSRRRPHCRRPRASVAVLAQRQALVDGAPVDADLRDLGGGRHAARGRGGRTRVVLDRRGGRRRARRPGGPRRRVPLRGGGRARAPGRAPGAGDPRPGDGDAGGRRRSGRSSRARSWRVSVAPGDAVVGRPAAARRRGHEDAERAPRPEGWHHRPGRVAAGVKIEIGDLLVVIR